MFGSAPCILDTRHEIHSISVAGGLFLVVVARGVADLHAERSQRRSPMDEKVTDGGRNGEEPHGSQCERAGSVVSEGQEGWVDLHYNQLDPSEPNQVSVHQNQNWTQTQLDDCQRFGCDSIEQDSLNSNREEEEEEEEEDGDRKMKGEEDDDDVMVEEEEEDSSVTRGQSPDTPMTDFSFLDTETTYPISPEAGSPDEPSYSDPEGETHTSSTRGPTTSTTEPTTSTTEPTTSTTEPTTSTTEPTTSTTEPTTSTRGPTTSTKGPTTSTRGPTTSTRGPTTSTTEPTTSTTEPTTSTRGPTTFTKETTSSTTEPSPALLATLQELGECKDHSDFPQRLHQIAEAFVLQEDYERAVWCVQIERLYQQRLLHNLTTLQEHWERRCRSNSQGEMNSNTDLAAQQLDRLAHICKTHQRPSPGAEKCEAVDSVSMRVEDRLPSRSSVACASGMEEDHKVTDSTLSQSIYPIKSASALMNSHCSNDFAALAVAQDCRDSKGIGGFHRDYLIDGSLANGEEREGRAEFTDSQSEGTGQQTEREMDHTTQEGCAGSDPPTDGEMSRSKPEERQGGEEEQEVEEAEEALALDEEVVERDSNVCLKALLEEILVLAVKEQHTLVEVQQQENQVDYDQEEDILGVESIRDGAASLDDPAKGITVEVITPAPSLVSILKRRRTNECVAASSTPHKHPAKRRVRFKVPDDGFDQDEVGGDSCLLLFLLCLVTVVISLGGTALYCALGDAQSTVCTDFSRNVDFYLAQLHRGMDQLRQWLTPGF